MFTINGQTITLTRGDTAAIQPIPTVTATGDPYVFENGDRVVFRLRQLPDLGEVVEKDCLIDLVENTCTVTLHPADTIGLSMTEYRYEFELIDTNEGHYTFIANQKFIIGKELEQHG